jgi:hypothetical protein
MFLICCSNKLLARLPVLKIAVTVPGTANANADTNIATAVVFPKRRGLHLSVALAVEDALHHAPDHPLVKLFLHPTPLQAERVQQATQFRKVRTRLTRAARRTSVDSRAPRSCRSNEGHTRARAIRQLRLWVSTFVFKRPVYKGTTRRPRMNIV